MTDRLSGRQRAAIRMIGQTLGHYRMESKLGRHESTTGARGLVNTSYGFAASPDGRTILYSRIDSSIDDLMLVENFR